MPFWALSVAFHAAGLLLLMVLMPLASQEPSGGAAVSVVLRSETGCVGPETDEEMVDMECLETVPLLTTLLRVVEPLPFEEETDVTDPFDEDVLDVLAPRQTESPFFLVPLDAARHRVPQVTPAPAPIGPPPLPHPREASAGREPVTAAPQTATTGATPKPVVAARAGRRPARPGRRGAVQRGLRIRYAPRVLEYYPRLARQRGYEGTVIVLMVIDADGAVTGASLTRSSGHASLDEAALRIARAYRFVPPGHRTARAPAHRVLAPTHVAVRCRPRMVGGSGV